MLVSKRRRFTVELNSKITELIERLTELLRQQYNIQIPITDIDQIVEKIGGKVVEDPAIDIISESYVKKTGETTFEIAVSPHQTEIWKKYSKEKSRISEKRLSIFMCR